jgi:KaiC/GvpD/RAD55 family RecA-like ATPase
MNSKHETKNPSTIELGKHLDSLLNFNPKGDKGGLVLPSKVSPGTGNIVIKGRPGTGKSTLALQIAISCLSSENKSKYMSAYITLEEWVKHLNRKAEDLGWENLLMPLKHLHNVDNTPSTETMGNYLKDILTQPNNCPFKNQNCIGDINLEEGFFGDFCNSGCSHKKSDILHEPKVLIPTLSPRSLLLEDGNMHKLFWERYKQLENLLSAAKWLRDKNNHTAGSKFPELRVVCIDSLNVFGDRALNREEIYRIFDLFKRYEVIGIFIFEEDGVSAPDMPSNQDIIEFSADTVISLFAEEEKGHFIRYIEIEKSRYQQQAYGRHPFVIVPSSPLFCVGDIKEDFYNKLKNEPRYGVLKYIYNKLFEDGEYKNLNSKWDDIEFIKAMNLRVLADDNFCNNVLEFENKKQIKELYHKSRKRENNVKNLNRLLLEELYPKDIEKNHKDQAGYKALKIYPSLYGILKDSENEKDDKKDNENKPFDIGEKGLNKYILPNEFKKGGKVVLIKGPMHTFKTAISMNFLLSNMINTKENVLLIGFHNHKLLYKGKLVISNDLVNSNIKSNDSFFNDKSTSTLENLSEKEYPDICSLRNNNSKNDIELNVHKYEFDGHDTSQKDNIPNFVELVFKDGAILPEQFFAVLMQIFDAYEKTSDKGIKHVVVNRVNLIGVSYPFLRTSKTFGDLFMSVLTQFIRSKGADLVITGTVGDLTEANEIVNRTQSLSDAVISCDFCDLFGTRHVIVTGTGTVSNDNISVSQSIEPVPGVIKIEGEEPKRFSVDIECLRGLVGFNTGKIHRPGLTLHLFQQNESAEYNKSIKNLLHFTFSTPSDYNSPKISIGNGDNPSSKISIENSDNPSSKIIFDTFDNKLSEAMYHSLNMLGDSPVDRTIVCTVDEFWNREQDVNNPLVDFNQFPDFRKERNEYIVEAEENKNQFGKPYCSNVLFMVVNDDFKIELNDTSNVLYHQCKSWKELKEALENKDVPKNKDVQENKEDKNIYCDLYLIEPSEETKACVLMDILISAFKNNGSAHKSENKENQENQENQKECLTNAIKYLCSKNSIDRPEKEEISAALSLFKKSKDAEIAYGEAKKKAEDKARKSIIKNTKDDAVIPPKALVYLGWYPQIRNIFAPKKNSNNLESNKNTNNSNNLPADNYSACALPGRGVRGDWFLAIRKGSVSINLGKSIVDKLCERGEEYKRFKEGIGLPVRKEFYSANNPSAKEPIFKAWNGAKISINKIKEIHQKALRRSEIKHYENFRNIAPELWEDLLSFKSDDLLDIKSEAWNSIQAYLLSIPNRIWQISNYMLVPYNTKKNYCKLNLEGLGKYLYKFYISDNTSPFELHCYIPEKYGNSKIKLEVIVENMNFEVVKEQPQVIGNNKSEDINEKVNKDSYILYSKKSFQLENGLFYLEVDFKIKD